jgi:hypothetical protein
VGEWHEKASPDRTSRGERHASLGGVVAVRMTENRAVWRCKGAAAGIEDDG